MRSTEWRLGRSGWCCDDAGKKLPPWFRSMTCDCWKSWKIESISLTHELRWLKPRRKAQAARRDSKRKVIVLVVKIGARKEVYR